MSPACKRRGGAGAAAATLEPTTTAPAHFGHPRLILVVCLGIIKVGGRLLHAQRTGIALAGRAVCGAREWRLQRAAVKRRTLHGTLRESTECGPLITMRPPESAQAPAIDGFTCGRALTSTHGAVIAAIAISIAPIHGFQRGAGKGGSVQMATPAVGAPRLLLGSVVNQAQYRMLRSCIGPSVLESAGRSCTCFALKSRWMHSAA